MANSKWRESAEAIRGEIERGALKSGDHLPSETEVADHWRVSRMTAHRAMAYLQNLGLVNRQRRKGTTVAGEGERRAGIVAARRQGRWMHYRIVPPAEPALASILEAALVSCAADIRMQADRARLDRACCAARIPRALAGAPQPVSLPG